jgi:hypothetical protein
LPGATLAQIVREEIGNYRDRIYPPLTTLGLFIEQALSADGACQDAVARNLSERTALRTPTAATADEPSFIPKAFTVASRPGV